MDFEQGGDDGTLRHQDRLCVQDVDGLREQIMSEAHNSRYSIHPGNWDGHIPLIEFSCTENYHSSIKMAPYEDLYGQRCRSPIGWFKVGEAKLLGPNLVYQDVEKVKLIQERLKMAQSYQ
ncbi:uncharacterized protein LOC142179783 [Nicotiana tabacum]|uniref:Uncharacterized protein LOC142179783 n=1 Tax=Nicotiana tabacum TaxID=4097 RepID=A0AC58UBA8_TOBAC